MYVSTSTEQEWSRIAVDTRRHGFAAGLWWRLLGLMAGAAAAATALLAIGFAGPLGAQLTAAWLFSCGLLGIAGAWLATSPVRVGVGVVAAVVCLGAAFAGPEWQVAGLAVAGLWSAAAPFAGHGTRVAMATLHVATAVGLAI